MPPPMPTIGYQPRKGGAAGKVLLTAILVGAISGGLYWRKNRPSAEATAPAPTPDPQAVAAAAAAVPSAPLPVAAAVPHGPRAVSVRIDGPLETSLVGATGPEVGPALAQVITRTLVWWVEVPGDFRKGDKLDVLFDERPGEEPLVQAVRYESAKAGKTFRAYRYSAAGDTFARYFQADGEELELRLQPAPLDDYEQVTSLIRDGRRHKGVDFKAPVGTPVKATFAGTITRKNWNWRGNGNCLEVTESGGRRKALFLHLSELPKTVKVGDPIHVGQVIAASGNSGHSFAPHLHYQLMQGEERVLDPFDAPGAHRRALAVANKAAFDAEVLRLDALLTPSIATK